MIPAWHTAASAKLGTRETPGPANNPTIMAWAKGLGVKILGIAYGSDAVPWCGLFVAQCMAEAGFKPPAIAVRAAAWATWGTACEPSLGAVLVFKRAGGGHVGFCCGESATAYRVLGGNQGDQVSRAWIPKDRCVAVRWPPGGPPQGPRLAAQTTGVLSVSEA